MSRATSRLSHVTAVPTSAFSPFPPFDRTSAEFYRQEFLRHRWCLEQQREYYSERAILSAEWALSRIIEKLDDLCCRDGADELIAVLLKQFDVVTGLSAWDPTQAQH